MPGKDGGKSTALTGSKAKGKDKVLDEHDLEHQKKLKEEEKKRKELAAKLKGGKKG
jgi:hypothetical protein